MNTTSLLWTTSGPDTVSHLSSGLMNSTAVAGPDMTMARQLHYIMSAIVGPILCILGFIGNLFSVAVWCRPSMKSSTARYLTGQALADILVLLMFLVCDSAQAWSPNIIYSLSYGIFFSYIGYPMLFFAVVLSVWITVGLTVDRYIMVCWITSSKKYCNEKRAYLGLALITINSFIINLPHFASFVHVTPEDTPTNSSTEPQQTFRMTEFGGGAGGQFYEFWIHCIILILIPWVSVLTMNIMIIRKIGQSNKKTADRKSRDSVKKCRQSENQITRLLLTVTFAFLVFIGLQCIIQCFEMQKPEWADRAQVSSAFAFAKTGIVFNSSLNFVFYCLSGRRFRKEFLRLFGLVKKDAHSSSNEDRTRSSTKRSTSSTGM
uniref:G-protein coupled receptors family 1 profile domain-containing protein n=1 Tax=Biomphalaria glabrata TaxID=6526 RepID=A0A2C9L706_BIOGL